MCVLSLIPSARIAGITPCQCRQVFLYLRVGDVLGSLKQIMFHEGCQNVHLLDVDSHPGCLSVLLLSDANFTNRMACCQACSVFMRNLPGCCILLLLVRCMV
eukprot:gnl/TRDRNA2_/TRDRNA2_169796_c0_seq2.p2 gnl/TRDRNA2_/TRDRNA2_169796_c0~~gnl/TRDRNA2_/TRDRNA2_169796_c0_seq2.p2  ORF type:complete len:102 (-),score=5.35 gnl/TRDRNA2_/TRDRNA2_169796_c0_seq2:148-453(-)